MYCTLLYSSVLRCTVHRSDVLYGQYSDMPYNTVVYCYVQSITVQNIRIALQRTVHSVQYRLILNVIAHLCILFFSPSLIEHLPVIEGEGERILIDRARMATWSLMEAPPGIMGKFSFFFNASQCFCENL